MGDESSSNKVLSVLCHLSALLGVGFLLPLIVYLVTRNDRNMVSENAREALNFHLSLLIYILCCVPLLLIGVGFFLMWVVGIGGLVLAVVAAIRTSQTGIYRYPWTLRLVPA